MTVAGKPGLLNCRTAAEWLGISERTLFSLTSAGRVAAVRIGRNVRYRLSDLEAFVEGRTSVAAC